MSASVVVDSRWKRVGGVSPTALSDARLQLHHAAQIAVSAAISYLPARSDDSHTALTWIASAGALATEPITGAGTVRIGVRLQDLTLLVLDGELRVTDSFALANRTVADANTWLRGRAAEAGQCEAQTRAGLRAPYDLARFICHAVALPEARVAQAAPPIYWKCA